MMLQYTSPISTIFIQKNIGILLLGFPGLRLRGPARALDLVPWLRNVGKVILRNIDDILMMKWYYYIYYQYDIYIYINNDMNVCMYGNNVSIYACIYIYTYG